MRHLSGLNIRPLLMGGSALSGVTAVLLLATASPATAQATAQTNEAAQQAGQTQAPDTKQAPASSTGPSAANGADLGGEIIVTANRREQNVQSVGIAVSAFSGDTLGKLGIVQTDQLVAVTPGLQLAAVGGSPVIGLLSIRGVAQNDFSSHLESPNAFYVDEVYQASTSTSVQQLFDVSRVEVLRGPQGTLFGRNANGGLVQIVSNAPTDDLQGFAKVSIGDIGLHRFEGGIGGGLAEGVAGRLSVLRTTMHGYYKNDAGPDVNNDDTFAIRGRLRLRPTSDLTVDLSAGLYRIFDTTVGGGVVNGTSPNADGLGTPQPAGTPTGFGYVNPYGESFRVSMNFPGSSRRKQQDYSARLNWNLGSVTLSTISSFSRVQIGYEEDNDETPIDFVRFGLTADSKIITQEVRLSKSGGAFRWTAGAYYLNINGDYTQTLSFPTLTTSSKGLWSLDTRSAAVFGQAEYDLTNRLTLIAGARYTRDSKHYDYRRVCTGPLCSLITIPGSIGEIGLTTPVIDRHHEGDWSGRFEVNYKATDDILLYGSINRGYKAFSYNASFFGATPLNELRFRGEVLTAYEVGAKSDLFDRLIRLNAAAFYYDYKNYQAFDPRGINFNIVNAPAEIYGADADLTIRPGGGFTVLGGLSLLHTRVKDILIGGVPQDRQSAQAPKFTGSLTVNKAFDLGSAGTITAGSVFKYSSPQYAVLTNSPAALLRRDFLWNGRLSWTDAKQRYELGVSVNNLLDRRREIYAFDEAGPPIGIYKKYLALPRQVIADFRVNF